MFVTKDVQSVDCIQKLLVPLSIDDEIIHYTTTKQVTSKQMASL